MSSTILAPVQRVASTTIDHMYGRSSNRAGAPLPLIPRRVPSSTSHLTSFSAPPTPYLSSLQPPSKLVVEPPTPADSPQEAQPISFTFRRTTEDDSESSTSSPSDGTRPTITPRARKSRTSKVAPGSPPRSSTYLAQPPKGRCDESLAPETRAFNYAAPASPLAARRPPLKSRRFRLNLESIKARQANPSSEEDQLVSSSSALAPAVELPANVQSSLVRKKSGEPLKSSLKSSKRAARGSLAIVTATKSEPATPTHSKAVHFDAQLEHVKLFLAEQRPLAVSRDGSPTDTSGTDSDFPSFIYGTTASDEEKARKSLLMEVTNMPSSTPPDAKVLLEDLRLSPDHLSVIGRARVQNIAFQKWVAARFTFDWWQTTSEVTAKYSESVNGGKHDIFVFSIRLNDMLARIEGKTLVLALRYTVAGREIWDNNGKANYVARFSKAKPPTDSRRAEEGFSRPGNMVDLKSRLEKVIKDSDVRSRYSAPGKSEVPSLLNAGSLSSRYDFKASMKDHAWKPCIPSPPRHLRASTHPLVSDAGPKSKSPPSKAAAPATMKKLPSLSKGSPREVDDDVILPPPYVECDPEDLPFAPPPRGKSERNHTRGYFDLAMTDGPPGLRRTPPGSPTRVKTAPAPASASASVPSTHTRAFPTITLSSSQRTRSFPPMASRSPSSSPETANRARGLEIPVSTAALRESGDESGAEATTPSATSSSSASSSPPRSPRDGGDAWRPTMTSPIHYSNDYRQLLNR
jgi:hypothetical protein